MSAEQKRTPSDCIFGDFAHWSGWEILMIFSVYNIQYSKLEIPYCEYWEYEGD